MLIGELAKRGAVNVQTVRFYERMGLLPEPQRKASGYRVYAEAELRRLRFIRRAKQLGFSLREIRAILALRQRGRCPCDDVVRIAERHLRETGRQLRDLEAFRAELTQALQQWKKKKPRRLSGGAICQLIERTMEP